MNAYAWLIILGFICGYIVGYIHGNPKYRQKGENKNRKQKV